MSKDNNSPTNPHNPNEQPPEVNVNNDTITNPVGLNFQSFLPQPQSVPNTTKDLAIMENLLNQTNHFNTIITNRVKVLTPIASKWSEGNVKEAIYLTRQLNDLGIINDILYFGIVKCQYNCNNIKLENAIDLFPSIINIISSKYESYIHNGIESSWAILRMFKDSIIRGKNQKDSNLNKKYEVVLRFFGQVRSLPNVNSLVNGTKKIEGFNAVQFASEVDAFIKQCMT